LALQARAACYEALQKLSAWLPVHYPDRFAYQDGTISNLSTGELAHEVLSQSVHLIFIALGQIIERLWAVVFKGIALQLFVHVQTQQALCMN